MEHPAERLFLLVATTIAMFCLGATQSISDFSRILQRPKPFIIGMISQFGLMPIIAYGAAVILDLADDFALGLIIIASAPGGIISNLLTYFAKGNVSLSI